MSRKIFDIYNYEDNFCYVIMNFYFECAPKCYFRSYGKNWEEAIFKINSFFKSDFSSMKWIDEQTFYSSKDNYVVLSF